MILEYYNLAEQPFGVTPDPRYLYLSATHREALGSVLHGVHSGRGFVALIAEPGMGKTTLLFHLLRSIQSFATTVFIFQTQVGPHELIKSVLADLEIEDDGANIVATHAKMNDALLKQSRLGKRFVLVIDEAQNLDEPVLEVVRMLSNFETPREKLMQIVLAGQPQLAEKLASPQLIQLRQRISILARLTKFNMAETRQYIDHRLRIAGYKSDRPLFSDESYAMIAWHSQGIPRNISNLCFNAMSLGCVMKQQTIAHAIIEEVVNDLDLAPLAKVATTAPEACQTSPGNLRTLEASNPAAVPAPKRAAHSFVVAASLLLLGVLGTYSLWARGHFGERRSPKTVTSDGSQSVKPGLPGSQAVSQSSTDPLKPEQTSREAKILASEPQPKAAESASEGDSLEGSRWVSVSPNDTLCAISRRNFGRCEARILDKIRDLNPGLKDPDLILSGWRIRIPVVRKATRDLDSAVEPSKKDLGRVSGEKRL